MRESFQESEHSGTRRGEAENFQEVLAMVLVLVLVRECQRGDARAETLQKGAQEMLSQSFNNTT